jgi:hypothetical protein
MVTRGSSVLLFFFSKRAQSCQGLVFGMFITYKMLQAKNPCRDQLVQFKDTYPAGVELSLQEALKALGDGFDVPWLAVFLDKPQQREFAQACANRVKALQQSTQQIGIAAAAKDASEDPSKKPELDKAVYDLKASYEAYWSEVAVLAGNPTAAARTAASAVRLSAKAQEVAQSKPDSSASEQALANERAEQVRLLVPMLLKKFPGKPKPGEEPSGNGRSTPR